MSASNWRERVTERVSRIRNAPRRVGIPVGVALILGGTILAPLPVFGVWMVPLGLAILAPHSPWAERMSHRMYWWRIKMLRWSVRYNFVRIKRVPSDRTQPPPPES